MISRFEKFSVLFFNDKIIIQDYYWAAMSLKLTPEILTELNEQ